ncbi:beta-1,3-endoglucanase [Paraphaeosphaeria sporulosa]
MRPSALVALLALAWKYLAECALIWTYNSINFFDKVDFISVSLPALSSQSASTASSQTHTLQTSEQYNSGFAQCDTEDATVAYGKVYLGVDAQKTYGENSTGCRSVRIPSKAVFHNGLLVADFAPLPEAGNGMWPA